MNLLERIRRFWGPPREPDHPQSERERAERPRESRFDEQPDSIVETFFGDAIDKGPTDRPR